MGHGGKKFLTPNLSKTDVSLLSEFGASTRLANVYVVQHSSIRTFPKAEVIAKAKAKVYGKGKNLEKTSNSTAVKKRTPGEKNILEREKERLGRVLMLSFSSLKLRFNILKMLKLSFINLKLSFESLKLNFSNLKHIYDRRRLRFINIIRVQMMI